jgi:hypothetical protein
MVGKAENRSNAATAFFPQRYASEKVSVSSERFKVVWPDACLTETGPLYVVDNFVDD